MKYLLIFILGFMPVQDLDINAIRTAYKTASEDKEKAEDFYNKLEKVSNTDKVELVAYKASAITLKAKFAKGLKNKKDGFIEGVTLLEETIKRDPNNIELRLIRLSIQENTPGILRYKSEIETDKDFILKQYNSIKSTTLKDYIKDYIAQSKKLSAEEKSVISD
jgi:ribosomal protein S8